MMHRPQILLFAAFTLAAWGVAASQTLSDCVAVDNDADRLACYDRVTRASRGEPAPAAEPVVKDTVAAPAAAAPAVAATATPPTPPPPAPFADDTEDFGFESRKTATGTQHIETRYDGNFTGWSGKTLFRLENGQVWKQTQSGRVSYRAERPAITIKRAAFGSFRLHVEGLNRSIRVTRVK